MKQKLIVIVVVIVLIIVLIWLGIYTLNYLSQFKPKTPLEPTTTTENILYQSNFNNPDEISDWQIIDAADVQSGPSDWQITGGYLIQESAIFQKDKNYSGSMAILKESKDWKNYQVNINFIPVARGGLGFLVRYQDDKNYYKILINSDSQSGNKLIRIEKMKNGQTEILYQIPKSYNLKKTNNLIISVNNNKINCYLNSDQITIYGVDKNEVISSGGFGLLVSRMPDIKFDNLEINYLSKNTYQQKDGRVLGEKKQRNEEEDLDRQIDQLLKEIGIE